MQRKTLAIALLLASATVSAEMYKWVDENGVAHYSSTRPTGLATEKVAPPPKLKHDPDAKLQELKLKAYGEPESDKIPGEEDKIAEALERGQKEAEIRMKNCETAKVNLDTITNNPIVSRKNAAGESVRLSRSERETALKDANAQVSEFCNP